MTFWSYMLSCADGHFYTGHTDDLTHRMAQHRAGDGGDFTRRRRPVELVWSQEFPTRLEALEAERIVGGWSRAKKQALIAGDWDLVSFFARPPGKRVSTMLDTNGVGDGGRKEGPFASSIVEKHSPQSEGPR